MDAMAEIPDLKITGVDSTKTRVPPADGESKNYDIAVLLNRPATDDEAQVITETFGTRPIEGNNPQQVTVRVEGPVIFVCGTTIENLARFMVRHLNKAVNVANEERLDALEREQQDVQRAAELRQHVAQVAKGINWNV